ncbi:hypothetical protein [Flavobacterium sp. ov086]|uniref:hypothetical protein n=1 Tax=Flavobacterium sp. ov086 TaxID=1761785 RepID=UPI000B74BB11|nr:hypothetical protein [Flavobacterium sp. ov086]SNR55310.1 hypothetical protein SAMN04487979_11114 [Flavobacterium sp. ov086]
MKKIVLILVLLVVLTSCKKIRMRPCPDCFIFYFESPQPNNDSEMDHFPIRFRGVYIDKDSTFLRIEEDRMIYKYFWKYKIHKTEFDSIKQQYKIVGNEVTNKDTNEKSSLHKIGDSIEFTTVSIDTFFRLSYYHKLKRIDGQLIMSMKDSIFWRINFLSLKNNKLRIKEIYLPGDLKKLDSVTSIKGEKLDSMSYLIKPTRNEFKRMLKFKNFGTDEEYDKVSK